MPNINVNGVRLNYEDTGKGKPVVFLHGYVGDTEDWVNQVKLLSHKYRCLTIDQRGRGKAEAPKRPEDYNFNLFIDDIYQWLKQIKVEKFVLNGHSMGGMISQRFVLAHPEMVTGLILAATSSGGIQISQEEIKLRANLNEIAMTQGTELTEGWFVNGEVNHGFFDVILDTISEAGLFPADFLQANSPP